MNTEYAQKGFEAINLLVILLIINYRYTHTNLEYVAFRVRALRIMCIIISWKEDKRYRK